MYDYVREELGVCYLEDAGFTLHGHLLIALLLQLPGPGAVQLLTNLQKTKKNCISDHTDKRFGLDLCLQHKQGKHVDMKCCCFSSFTPAGREEEPSFPPPSAQ